MKRSHNLHNYFLKNINPVIRFMILSDVVIVSGAGLLGPIFALFITKFIDGGNEAVAGIAAAIFLITRSVFQIPIATFIDKVRGEKDDFYFMVIFTILGSFVTLFYLIISEPWQLYVVQFISGVFSAMVLPSYMAIFTRHIDKHKEGTEWGIYSTLVDLAGAATAAIGGYMAFTLGFEAVIIAVVIISVIGSVFLIPIKPYLKKKT